MTDELIKRLRHADAPYAKPTALEILTDEAADLIEQQATRIAALEAKCALFAASLAQSEREVEERDVRIAALATVAPAVDAQPVACLICNSTGNATPCAYPTEINRQQAARIERLLKEELSLHALYEDACIQANKNAKDAERYRHLRQCNSGSLVIVQIIGTGEDDQIVLTEEHADEAIDAALSKQKAGEQQCDQTE